MNARQKRRQQQIDALIAAAQALALAHHEIGFTEGYRAHRETKVSSTDAEAVRLYEKNMAQWKPVEAKIQAFKMRLARAIPKSQVRK